MPYAKVLLALEIPAVALRVSVREKCRVGLRGGCFICSAEMSCKI